jgi:hypothetical protein
VEGRARWEAAGSPKLRSVDTLGRAAETLNELVEPLTHLAEPILGRRGRAGRG